jgi:outer membrane protein assembly factor BamB
MWTITWNNKGYIISADGLFDIYEEKNGNIALVKPFGEKPEIIS